MSAFRPRRALFVALLLLAAALTGAPAATAAVSTPTWVPVNTMSRPPARGFASAAYDPATSQFVLFGGSALSGFANDTWLWAGLSWTNASTLGNNPSPRGGAGTAYDAATSQLILVGGGADQSTFSDTWTWDGRKWVQLHPATSPPGGRQRRHGI